MKVWRVINFTMAVFCFLAVLVNVNDDDWYLWIPIYIIPAILCTLIAWNPHLTGNKIWNSLCDMHIVLCIAYAVYQVTLLVAVLGGQMKNPLQYEEGREMGGLFIILAWIGLSRFSSIGRPDVLVTNTRLMNGLLWITVFLAIVPLSLWSLCYISDWHNQIGHCNGMFA